MAWTSPKEWSGDELLTASDLNQYVSDNLSALYALVQGGGRKNLLHNGAMQVAQRGTSVTGITSTTAYSGGTWTGGTGMFTADRWLFAVGTLGTWTNSVESDAPTGSGFRKSYKVLITANADTAPVDAGDYAYVQTTVEGQNAQSIKKGTASAEPLTLSFWTKSNKTGTYVAELVDADNNRHVAATYTVASSGTWEQQTITFPADLTGAFDNDNNYSLGVVFWLASGSTYSSGTLPTSWAAKTDANRAVGVTNLAETNNNSWQVTGCQLEIGSASTGFEFKGFEQELAECQRYYQKSYAYGTVPGTGASPGIRMAKTHPSTLTRHFILGPNLPVTMRATPNTTIYSEDGTVDRISIYNDSATRLTVTTSNNGTSDSSLGTYLVTSNNGVANEQYYFHYALSADL